LRGSENIYFLVGRCQFFRVICLDLLKVS
jgi:hypothetical protein